MNFTIELADAIFVKSHGLKMQSCGDCGTTIIMTGYGEALAHIYQKG